MAKKTKVAAIGAYSVHALPHDARRWRTAGGPAYAVEGPGLSKPYEGAGKNESAAKVVASLLAAAYCAGRDDAARALIPSPIRAKRLADCMAEHNRT